MVVSKALFMYSLPTFHMSSKLIFVYIFFREVFEKTSDEEGSSVELEDELRELLALMTEELWLKDCAPLSSHLARQLMEMSKASMSEWFRSLVQSIDSLVELSK